jgi:hypothetical protein
VLTHGGNRAGGRPRRRLAAAAARGSSPANWRHGPDNKWLEELWWCIRKGTVHSSGHRANRNKELAVRPLMAGWRLYDMRQRWFPRAKRVAALYRRSCLGEGVTQSSTGSRYDTRAVRGATANGSPGAAQRVYGDVAVGWSAPRAETCGTRGVGEKGGGMAVPRRADQRTKDRPWRADPADRGAATATPLRARAL